MMQETKYLKCLEALYNLDGAVVASVHLENTVIIILESMVIQKAQFWVGPTAATLCNSVTQNH